VFKQQSDVSSSFYYFNCANYYPNGECLEYQKFKSTSSYHPPFCYSYQCSSFIIRFYAPVFVFVCLLSSFILPLSQLLIIKLRIAQQKKLFGTIFYPTQQTNNENISSNNTRLDTTTTSSSSSPTSSSEITTKHMRMDEIYKLIIQQLTSISLLLTFGTIFPPLSVAFFINICSETYYRQAIIGRYILYMMKYKLTLQLDILENNFNVQPVLLIIHRCCWMLLYVSCSFYTLFLFDILGDKVGFYKAYWILIVMPLFPFVIFIIYKFYRWIIFIKNYKNNSDDQDNINKNNQNKVVHIQLTSSSIISSIINPLTTTLSKAATVVTTTTTPKKPSDFNNQQVDEGLAVIDENKITYHNDDRGSFAIF